MNDPLRHMLTPRALILCLALLLATSDLPSQGGLAPNVGVNLHYFDDGKGLTQHMVPLNAPGPIWIDTAMTLKDASRAERLVAAYARMKDLGTCPARGILAFNDDKHCFDVVKEIPRDAPLVPTRHPFRAAIDGVDYMLFPAPYPTIRVKADWNSFMDHLRYEAFTRQSFLVSIFQFRFTPSPLRR